MSQGSAIEKRLFNLYADVRIAENDLQILIDAQKYDGNPEDLREARRIADMILRASAYLDSAHHSISGLHQRQRQVAR